MFEVILQSVHARLSMFPKVLASEEGRSRSSVMWGGTHLAHKFTTDGWFPLGLPSQTNGLLSADFLCLQILADRVLVLYGLCVPNYYGRSQRFHYVEIPHLGHSKCHHLSIAMRSKCLHTIETYRIDSRQILHDDKDLRCSFWGNTNMQYWKSKTRHYLGNDLTERHEFWFGDDDPDIMKQTVIVF